MAIKAIKGIANPLGTVDSYGTVIESISNISDGVEIKNRHAETIGQGFLSIEGDNVMLTGYVEEDAYKAENIDETGLSIGFNLDGGKARLVDGLAYYKNVTVTEVSLTPKPANKGAKITGVREEEEEEEEEEKENTEMNKELLEMLTDAKTREAQTKLENDAIKAELAEIKKQREAATKSAKPADKKREVMKTLGDKMREMPEKGFLREFTNASDLSVVNTLAGISSKYAKKSAIFDGAYKARFAGMTLTEDGVSDGFLEGMFKAGSDKNRKQTAGSRSVRPQMAEAYLEMDKATVIGANDSNAVSEYVMSVIPNRVIQKIEYNMLYGANDGTNGIYGLKGKTADNWTPQIEATSLFEGITDAVAMTSVSDDITIAMSGATFAKLRKEVGSDGHSRFNELATKTQIANSFGASTIEIRSWIKDGDVFVWNTEEFVLTGNFNMDSYTDFDLRYNVNQWLAEMLVGGSIRGLNRSAVVTLKTAAA